MRVGSHTVSPKAFKLESKFDRDQKRIVKAYRIYCSTCTGQDQVRPMNSAGTLPPEVVEKMFMKKGWHLGSTRTSDMCPNCQEAVKRDRQARDAERKQANIEALTYAASKPVEQRTHPASGAVKGDDHRLAALIDRANSIYSTHVRNSAIVEELIDRLATDEKMIAEIVEEIVALSGHDTIGPKRTPFDNIPILGTIPGRFEANALPRGKKVKENLVEVAHYTKDRDAVGDTVLMITRDLCTKLGLPDAGNRIEIEPGVGEDAGIVRVRPAEDPMNSYKGQIDPRGHARFHIRRQEIFRPAIFGTRLSATPVSFKIDPEDEKSLVFRKPPFFIPDSVASTPVSQGHH